MLRGRPAPIVITRGRKDAGKQPAQAAIKEGPGAQHVLSPGMRDPAPGRRRRTVTPPPVGSGTHQLITAHGAPARRKGNIRMFHSIGRELAPAHHAELLARAERRRLARQARRLRREGGSAYANYAGAPARPAIATSAYRRPEAEAAGEPEGAAPVIVIGAAPNTALRRRGSRWRRRPAQDTPADDMPAPRGGGRHRAPGRPARTPPARSGRLATAALEDR